MASVTRGGRGVFLALAGIFLGISSGSSVQGGKQLPGPEGVGFGFWPDLPLTVPFPYFNS
jgi:hypothetical protein